MARPFQYSPGGLSHHCSPPAPRSRPRLAAPLPPQRKSESSSRSLRSRSRVPTTPTWWPKPCGRCFPTRSVRVSTTVWWYVLWSWFIAAIRRRRQSIRRAELLPSLPSCDLASWLTRRSPRNQLLRAAEACSVLGCVEERRASVGVAAIVRLLADSPDPG